MLNIYAKSLPDVSVDQPFYYVLVLLPLAETNANAPRTLVTDDLARCVLTAVDSCRSLSVNFGPNSPKPGTKNETRWKWISGDNNFSLSSLPPQLPHSSQKLLLCEAALTICQEFVFQLNAVMLLTVAQWRSINGRVLLFTPGRLGWREIRVCGSDSAEDANKYVSLGYEVDELLTAVNMNVFL